jgi:hypothetical protein
MRRSLLLYFLLVATAVTSAHAYIDRLVSNGTYWHNWADAQGITHMTECHFKNYSKVNLLPPSDPLFLEAFGPAANIQIANQPPGWKGPWHRNPVPQLVFFLKGVGFWRSQDGSEHVFVPGDVMFGNDQNATLGHESYAYNNETLILVMVQFPKWSTTKARPCWLGEPEN